MSATEETALETGVAIFAALGVAWIGLQMNTCLNAPESDAHPGTALADEATGIGLLLNSVYNLYRALVAAFGKLWNGLTFYTSLFIIALLFNIPYDLPPYTAATITAVYNCGIAKAANVTGDALELAGPAYAGGTLVINGASHFLSGAIKPSQCAVDAGFAALEASAGNVAGWFTESGVPYVESIVNGTRADAGEQTVNFRRLFAAGLSVPDFFVEYIKCECPILLSPPVAALIPTTDNGDSLLDALQLMAASGQSGLISAPLAMTRAAVAILGGEIATAAEAEDRFVRYLFGGQYDGIGNAVIDDSIDLDGDMALFYSQLAARHRVGDFIVERADAFAQASWDAFQNLELAPQCIIPARRRMISRGIDLGQHMMRRADIDSCGIPPANDPFYGGDARAVDASTRVLSVAESMGIRDDDETGLVSGATDPTVFEPCYYFNYTIPGETAPCIIYQNVTITDDFTEQGPGCILCDNDHALCPGFNPSVFFPNGDVSSFTSVTGATCVPLDINSAPPCVVQDSEYAYDERFDCPCAFWDPCTGRCGFCATGYTGDRCDECDIGYTNCTDDVEPGIQRCVPILPPTPGGIADSCAGNYTCFTNITNGPHQQPCSLCENGGTICNGTCVPPTECNDPDCFRCNPCTGECLLCDRNSSTVLYDVTGTCISGEEICEREGFNDTCAICYGDAPYDCASCLPGYVQIFVADELRCVNATATCQAACGQTIGACNPANAANTCNKCHGGFQSCASEEGGVCECIPIGANCTFDCNVKSAAQPRNSTLTRPPRCNFAQFFLIQGNLELTALNTTLAAFIRSATVNKADYGNLRTSVQQVEILANSTRDCITDFVQVFGVNRAVAAGVGTIFGTPINGTAHAGDAAFDFVLEIIEAVATGTEVRFAGSESWDSGRPLLFRDDMLQFWDSTEASLALLDPDVATIYGAAGRSLTQVGTLVANTTYRAIDLFENPCKRIDFTPEFNAIIDEGRLVVGAVEDVAERIGAGGFKKPDCDFNNLNLFCTGPELVAGAVYDALDALEALGGHAGDIVCDREIPAGVWEPIIIEFLEDTTNHTMRLLFGLTPPDPNPNKQRCGAFDRRAIYANGSTAILRVITVWAVKYGLETSALARDAGLPPIAVAEKLVNQFVKDDVAENLMGPVGEMVNCIAGIDPHEDDINAPGALWFGIREVGIDAVDWNITSFAEDGTIWMNAFGDMFSTDSVEEKAIAFEQAAIVSERILVNFVESLVSGTNIVRDLKAAINTVVKGLNLVVVDPMNTIVNFLCSGLKAVDFAAIDLSKCKGTIGHIHKVRDAVPEMASFFTDTDPQRMADILMAYSWAPGTYCYAAAQDIMAGVATSKKDVFDGAVCYMLRYTSQDIIAASYPMTPHDLLYNTDHLPQLIFNTPAAIKASSTCTGDMHDCMILGGVASEYAGFFTIMANVNSTMGDFFTEQAAIDAAPQGPETRTTTRRNVRMALPPPPPKVPAPKVEVVYTDRRRELVELDNECFGVASQTFSDQCPGLAYLDDVGLDVVLGLEHGFGSTGPFMHTLDRQRALFNDSVVVRNMTAPPPVETDISLLDNLTLPFRFRIPRFLDIYADIAEEPVLQFRNAYGEAVDWLEARTGAQIRSNMTQLVTDIFEPDGVHENILRDYFICNDARRYDGRQIRSIGTGLEFVFIFAVVVTALVKPIDIGILGWGVRLLVLLIVVGLFQTVVYGVGPFCSAPLHLPGLPFPIALPVLVPTLVSDFGAWFRSWPDKILDNPMFNLAETDHDGFCQTITETPNCYEIFDTYEKVVLVWAGQLDTWAGGGDAIYNDTARVLFVSDAVYDEFYPPYAIPECAWFSLGLVALEAVQLWLVRDVFGGVIWAIGVLALQVILTIVRGLASVANMSTPPPARVEEVVDE